MRWRTQELFFRQLIARNLEIPVVGKVFFAFPAGSSTSLYEEWIETELDIPSELKFQGNNAILNAYAEMSAGRNDTILAFPGAYTITNTDGLVWNKQNCHLIGLAGPNVRSDYSEPAVHLHTATAETAATFTISTSAYNCQIHNMGFTNNGASANNLAAVKINGRGAHFKNCMMMGIMNSTQMAAVACHSLGIHSYGSHYLIENCKIGSTQWGGARTTDDQGQLCFTNTSGWPKPANGKFLNCLFESQSETAEVPMVRFAHVNAIDRMHMFENCVFYNFSTNWTNTCKEVFQYQGVVTNCICLKDCMAIGYDEWQTLDYGTMFQSNMPVATTGGGLAIEPTTSIA